MAAIIFLVPGVFYWIFAHVSPARCLYGDPTCSLTFATYILCLLTGLAFLAAFRAARWALKTYLVAADALMLEQSRILVENYCRTEQDRMQYADVILQNGILQRGRPDEDSEQLFLAMDFQFSSLGRTGIVDPTLTLRVKYDDCRKDVVLPDITVGSVRPDGTTHVRLWLDQNDLAVLVAWDESGAKQFSDGRDIDLVFRALPARKPPARRIFPLRRTIAESAGNAAQSAQREEEESLAGEAELKTPAQAPVPKKASVADEK